jgi:hypothetical protein
VPAISGQNTHEHQAGEWLGSVGVSGEGYGAGVFGYGTQNGVYGQVDGTAPCESCTGQQFFAAAIHGVANHQYAYAVHGTNNGAGGTGVRGFATGVNGVGVDGLATRTSFSNSFVSFRCLCLRSKSSGTSWRD